MDEQPTLPPGVRASLPPVVQAYLAHQDSQIALLREQIVTLQAQLSKLGCNLPMRRGANLPTQAIPRARLPAPLPMRPHVRNVLRRDASGEDNSATPDTSGFSCGKRT